MQNTLIFPIMSITYIICIYIYYRERDEDFRKLDRLILKPMILVIPHGNPSSVPWKALPQGHHELHGDLTEMMTRVLRIMGLRICN